MTEYLSPEDLANDITMCRSGFPGTIIVIEGETDQTVFERFFDLAACQLLPANSKNNALQAFESLSQQDRLGVIVIVDADFDRFLGTISPIANVFTTDFHDLEIMMIESPSFNTLLRQYASSGKIAKARKTRANALVKDILYEAVLPLGILRLISIRMGLSLVFENINCKKFIHRDFKANTFKTVSYILQFTKGKTRNPEVFSLDYKEVAAKVDAELRSVSVSEWPQLCCGHDVAAALSFALMRFIGSVKNGKVENVEKSLRLSYDLNSFKASTLCSELIKWEATSSEAYKIF